MNISPSSFGINLIGDFSGGIGLGITTRAIATLLQSKGVPFSLFEIPYAWGQPQYDQRFKEEQVATIGELPYPVNLYVLPLGFYQTFFDTHPEFLARKRLHIANFWWETTRFPASWIEKLGRFDAILSMSHFITEVCRNSLPLTSTLYGEYPLDLPPVRLENRSAFGLAGNALVFVASLDPNADPARKNPATLISAFRAAFPAVDQDVRLVIRINNATTPLGQQVVAHMQQLAQGDGRISFLLEPMRYDEILSLYACADVYLSFHRGEGLGLGMLESMALGKAVIATGWSGNLSFMNHSNSALLRCRLIPVSGNFTYFRPEVIGPDARWAEPVLEDAVAWMRQLRHNPALRHELGARAKVSALAYLKRANEAPWITELADLWRSQGYLPRVVEKLSFPGE
ncbi:MAG: glycosyltransferase family 4 protein [Pseudomonadota bacterium]